MCMGLRLELNHFGVMSPLSALLYLETCRVSGYCTLQVHSGNMELCGSEAKCTVAWSRDSRPVGSHLEVQCIFHYTSFKCVAFSACQGELQNEKWGTAHW